MTGGGAAIHARARRCALAAAWLWAAAMGQANAADSVDIPVILPLTGGASFLGQGEKEALELLERMVNGDGGIQGRALRFLYQDDQSSPQVAVQLTTQAIATRPAVVLGSAMVGTCSAQAPLAPAGPVIYCLSPGIHPKPGAYTFTSHISTHDLASTLVRFFRLRGLTKLALITSTDASGQDADRGFKEVLARPENGAMQLVREAHFNPADISVAAQMERIKEAQPQALIAWSTGATIGTVLRAVTEAGLDVPVATTDGNMTYPQMTQYAAIMPRELYIPTSAWPEGPLVLAPEVARQLAAFHAAYRAVGKLPDQSAVLAWDPTLMVVNALRQLGPAATATQLHDYLLHLKGYAGINGFYDFEKVPQRGLDEQETVITRWNPGRKVWEIVSQGGGQPLAP